MPPPPFNCDVVITGWAERREDEAVEVRKLVDSSNASGAEAHGHPWKKSSQYDAFNSGSGKYPGF